MGLWGWRTESDSDKVYRLPRGWKGSQKWAGRARSQEMHCLETEPSTTQREGSLATTSNTPMVLVFRSVTIFGISFISVKKN